LRLSVIPGRSGAMNHKRSRLVRLVGTALTVIAALLLLLTLAPAKPTPTRVALSIALSDVSSHKIVSATLNDQLNTATFVETKAAGGHSFIASYPFAYGGDLTKQLLADNVKVTTSPPSSGLFSFARLVELLPQILFIGVLIWVVKSGALGIGKFSGKRGEALGAVPSTRFSDVAGCDEAVAELRELVEFLTDGERFTILGAKPPKGGLLVGPPGTGKTLLARAVAGEAGVPFFALSGSDFVETFVGVGAKRVRGLFDKARTAGKAIVFIDEIDAIGGKRGDGPQHAGNTERDNTLVSMLNEMDGFTTSGIIVLAATNRADVLDPALTRPGRLDRHIQVPLPDRRGREQILAVHARGIAIAPGVDLLSIARQTPGMSGADLAQVVNEACMEAARRGGGSHGVDQDCFQAAIAAVAMGRARTSALVTDHDRVITAWHEGGHTVAALLLPDADDPVSVTIVPRGPAGGVTWMGGNDNIFLTRKHALAQLVISLAGRAAEEILMDGEFTQGASSDLQAATSLAQAMVTRYGMTDFGYAQLDDQTMAVGGAVALRAHEAIEELLQTAHGQAQQLLALNGELLRLVATTLLDEETLSRARIGELAVLATSTPGALAEGNRTPAEGAVDLTKSAG
jgi:cell division protease FtsH